MAVVANSSSFQGAVIEIGTFTLDPASIADNSQGIETVTVAGAKVGDLVFINGEALPLGAIIAGAKVTATNTVSVYINNETGGALDIGSKTWDYLLVKLS